MFWIDEELHDMVRPANYKPKATTAKLSFILFFPPALGSWWSYDGERAGLCGHSELRPSRML